MADEPERILHGLYGENFKRVELVDLTFGPDPGLIVIAGANGEGKTSTLDMYSAAVGGKDEIQAAPIRNGTDKSVVRADLGDLIVERTFTRDADGKTNTKVIVRSADKRSKWDSPQKMLSSFLGTFSLDPLAFLAMKPPEQFKAVQRFVPNHDFEKSAKQYTGLFQSRTDVNRETLRYTRAAEAIAYPPDTPAVRVSIERLSKELEKAGTKNTERQTFIARQKTIDQDEARYVAAIDDMRAKIAELQERITKGLAAIETLKAEAKALVVPPEVDTSAIRRQLEQANLINRNVDLRKQREEHERQAAASEREAAELTASLQALKDADRMAVEQAKMPVAGLSLADGQVTMNGVPFEQSSHAEQLRVAVALAAAENPSLRVILVREGSLMDKKSLKLMSDLAIEFRLRILVEMVDESNELGIVIENGRVKSTPESRTKKK